MTPPRPFAVDHDGLRIAGLDWGGGSAPLLLLHPNGFNAGFFDPVARRLAEGGRFRPVGIDLRGHGASDKPPPPEPYRYELMAADVAAVLDALGLEDVAVVGGSLGGGVAIHLDRVQPGRLRRLLLCEAVAVPAPEGQSPENPMVAAALRRRVVWPSRAKMIASYGARPPLDRLEPEALAAYVEWGTVLRPDGTVELACPPEVEAAIFGSPPVVAGVRSAWEHLAHLSAPAVILAGAGSGLATEWFEDQAERAGAPFVLVDGGHFFLHEDTDRAVALVSQHVG
ncbi:MAG: alpha/beta fold hydrolase [Acidimicrobiia bacterium]